MAFGSGLTHNEIDSYASIGSPEDERQDEFLINKTVAGHDRSSRPKLASLKKSILNDSGVKLSSQIRSFTGFNDVRNSVKANMWRDWSMQRAGFSDSEFEAAEIAFDKSRESDASKHEVLLLRERCNEPLDRRKESTCGEEIDCKHIRTCLQSLESELSTALRSLKPKSDEFSTPKSQTSADLLKLSDAWEFQENEIMNAQNTLRSIRAKLAVVEGKMALAMINAQKVVEEKQKGTNDACHALRILRTACIVWPNSASEVLLAGSFDGWSTQRRMEKSSTGIFSLCLKLYPGRYEIKFIVDGIWRIDPLRPIVNNSGFENNLLIIT